MILDYDYEAMADYAARDEDDLPIQRDPYQCHECEQICDELHPERGRAWRRVCAQCQNDLDGLIDSEWERESAA